MRGNQDTAWIRLVDGTAIQVAIDTLQIGDELVVHDHVAIPVDGEVVDGEAIVDQSAITGETLPVSIAAGAHVDAGSVVIRGPRMSSPTPRVRRFIRAIRSPKP